MTQATHWFADKLIDYNQSQDTGMMIIKIPSWEYFELKAKAKEMEKQMVIDIVEKSRATGLTAEYLLLTYGSKGIALQNESESKVITELSDEEIKPKHKVGKFIVEAIKEKIARTSSQTEKMYSEEDMIEFAKWVFLEVGSNTGKDRTNKELFNEWFEQFKKK